MKNKTPILLLVLLLLLTVGGITSANAAYSDNVLFEYDFEDYEGNAPSKEAGGITLGTLKNQKATHKLYAGEEADGNTYLYSSYSKYIENGGTNWGNAGIQLTFADTFQTTGKVSVSFDIGRGTLTSASPTEDSKIVIRDLAKSLYLITANATDGKFYGYSSGSTIANGEEDIKLDFKLNTKHRVDILFDLDTQYVYAYIDGELLTMRSGYTNGLANSALQFRLEHVTPYIDNIKVAKVTDSTFEGAVSVSDGYIDAVFTETPAKGAITDDVKIINMVNGEALTVTEVKALNSNTVRISYDGDILPGAEYIIKGEKAITSFCGTELFGGELSFVSATSEKAIKRIKLIDYLGNEYYAAENLPPQIKTIVVYYSGFDAQPDGTISVKEGETTLPYETPVYNADKQTLTITLNEYLFGEKTYTMTVEDAVFSEAYPLEFTTKAGSLEVKSFSFENADGSEAVLATLADGAKINLVVEIIKTIPEKRDMVLSYSAWENGYMRGFNYEKIALSEVETYAERKIENITISKNSTLTIDAVKGFLWSDLGKNNPLVEEKVLN